MVRALSTIIAMAVGMLALTLLGGCAPRKKDGLAAIERRGQVAVCEGLDGPPFGYIDRDGKAKGLYHDLAGKVRDAIAKKLGRPLDLTSVRETPASRVQFIKEGRCDFMFLMESGSRAGALQYSREKFYAIGAVFVAPKSLHVTHWQDLRGRKVCGALGSAWMPVFEKKYGVEYVTFYNPAEVQKAVADGRCLGQITGVPPWERMQRSGKWQDFEAKFPPDAYFRMGIAFNRGDARMAALYDEIIRDWHRDGTIIALEKHYGIAPNLLAAAEHARYTGERSAPVPPAPGGDDPPPIGAGAGEWLLDRGYNFSILFSDFDRSRFASGLGYTMVLAIGSLILSVIIGVAGAAVTQMRAAWPRSIVTGYVELFRNTPVLAQIYFFYFGIGSLLPMVSDDAGGQVRLLGNVPWAIIALGLHAGAFQVEALRAAIEGVPARLVEAAQALGMNRQQTFRHLILPIAVRRALPTIGNALAQAIKSTSTAYAIAVPELLYASNRIWTEGANVPETMLMLFITYMALVGVVGWSVRRLEKRLALPGAML